MAEGRILVVCGALVVKGDKIVLVQEAQKSCYGKWNFPAGWLDYGEGIAAAAKREVKEETGFNVKLDGLIGVYEGFGKELNVVRFIFKASVISGKLRYQKGELLDAKWFTFEEFTKLKNDELRSLDMRKIVSDYKTRRLLPLDIIRVDFRR